MTNETKRAAVIAVIEQAMREELAHVDCADWGIDLSVGMPGRIYAALEAMAAADEGADLTDRKNCISHNCFDFEGKHIGGGACYSSDPKGDLQMIHGFLELEQAHRLHNVIISPHKLGALWVSSAPPKIVDLFPNARKIGVTSTPEHGNGAEFESATVGVDLAEAEDQTAMLDVTPESMILEHAQRLIDRADSYGVVVTIQTYPLGPLAMGNYVMLPAVRPRQAKHLLKSAAPVLTEPGTHVLYTDADKDRPDNICDSNGQTVLDLCKLCGRGECDLVEPCPGVQS